MGKRLVILFCTALLAGYSATAQECKQYNRETAAKDIQTGRAVLIVPGGFAPVIYPTDSSFTRKYAVAYHILGCVRAENDECLKAYNGTIAAWLDKRYGKVWRKEVREDIY